MRKILSYTILNNESDIIESFVRYNMTYIDKMIILDNGCTDSTIDILDLLKKEGYDIEIFDESLIDFEQYQIMNYYLRYLCENYKSDLIIPLDSDEFLMSDSRNVREILEEIPLDTVYEVNWRTFVMDKRNDMADDFICRQMKYSYLHKDHKVIIPTNLIKKYEIVLSVGQHSVTGKAELKILNAKELKMAHYPNRNMDQFCAKQFCHSIRTINYLNRQNGETLHRNIFAHQCMEHFQDDNREWFDEMISKRMEEFCDDKITFHPINLTKMGLDKLQMKYSKLAKTDVFKNVYFLAQVMAVKAYNLEIEKKFITGKRTILIYGTGKTALSLFKGYPENLVNVRAYLNSDPHMEFSMFEHRLVIGVRMLKFFRYDKIIIASKKFYGEIYEILKNAGLSDERISGPEYLLKLSMSQLKSEDTV